MNTVLGDSASVVVCHYKGLTVSEITDFRAQLRAEGGSFKVTKNTLAKLASEGTSYEGLKDLFTGPTGIAVSNDPVAAAKVVNDYAKENSKLEILGGAMGDSALDLAGVKAVAAMPSREELIASIVGCIGAPASNIAGAIGAPASNIASILSTIEEKAA